MAFRRKPENYAFIDNQNLNMTVNKLGWKMDWKKFRKFLKDRYGVTTAFMFIGYVPEQEEMYEKLHDAGYAIVLKPTFDMTRPRLEENEKPQDDREEKRQIKGNVDAELVLWAMKEINHYKQAVIVSSDGDFFSLVEYLVERNKLCKLLVPSSHYSKLFNQFDKHIERVDHFRPQLEYMQARKFQKR
jgi:uncharacterized LabA/DUF88 family protein